MAGGLACHSFTKIFDRPFESDYYLDTSHKQHSIQLHSPPMREEVSEDEAWRANHPSGGPRLPSLRNFLSEAGLSAFPSLSGSAEFTGQSPHSVAYERPSPFSETRSPETQLTTSPQRPTSSLLHEHRSFIYRLPDLSTFATVDPPDGHRTDPAMGSHGSAFSSPGRGITFHPSRPFATPSPPDAGHTRVVVREEVIPGKGLCYVYDDGTICQKIINGDTVNPKWGTTKAGKPRKRLGQACNTCREKKIKCDPNVPKCAQCQKFGRECKFETVTRTSYKSPTAQSATQSPSGSEAHRDEMTERTWSIGSSETLQDHVSIRADSRSSINVESLLSPSSTEATEYNDNPNSRRPSKKARFSISSQEGRDSQPPEIPLERPNEAIQLSSSDLSRDSFCIQSDPYDVNRELVLYYLSVYFSHINAGAYPIFPKDKFVEWVQKDKNKSRLDKMLLYAVLALGAVFGKGFESDEHRKVFSDIASETIVGHTEELGVQVVQTHLILSLLKFSTNDTAEAFESSRLALRSAFDLRLNTEDEKDDPVKNENACFGFSRTAYTECKRRTFWAAYVMDCFNGLFPQYNSAFDKLDINLRLPCADIHYKTSDMTDTPFFHDFQPSAANRAHYEPASMGTMAFLVQIATIFRQIVAHINHSRDQPRDEYQKSYETFLQDIIAQLHAWDRDVRIHLKLDPAGHRSRSADTTEESETGLHVLFHYSAMILYRYVGYEKMTKPHLVRNCNKAYGHARKTLELMQKITLPDPRTVPESKVARSSPVIGHAILVAIDVITAAGTMSHVLESESREGGGRQTMMAPVYAGIEVLESLTDYWSVAKAQLELVRQRVSSLLSASESGASSQKIAFFIREPLQSAFGPDEDIVYGLPRFEYLRALGIDKVKKNSDMYEIPGLARRETRY